MGAIKGARERARSEITASIKDEARRQLADTGAAQLSVRAVARALGMVSSAVYRYFPSRDELLTALIVDAYDALGLQAETALGAAAPDAAPVDRWIAVCGAARAWALAHPHEYALIYGSPVPGYAAPRDTVAPASRLARTLLRIASDAHAAGELAPPPAGEPPSAVRCDGGRLAAELAPGLPAANAASLVAAWAQLFGLIGFEVFGQLDNVIGDRARRDFFVHACAGLARGVGLTVRHARGPGVNEPS
ncbi:TetR family transcriptional regulator [Streptomyces carminius]|uniref:TetR family transcriptional regulator n=1 Tax=Streptomyces carminius TaxID=2665496 RepID=A0A2M8LT56_9ACTN|nr:TetR/AcrR family transcriptional regulator [Streptomyces carminius]PJE95116.1 TetR family transcriptional regulator [Streptomyces carminius]